LFSIRKFNSFQATTFLPGLRSPLGLRIYHQIFSKAIMPKTLSSGKTETREQKPADSLATSAAVGQPAPQPDPAAGTIRVDDSGARAFYSNFCRVTGTPEELILDFALNAQPFGATDESLKITQRLVMNHYTAKRLLQALHVSMQRHEAAFGVLETDIQKRFQGQHGQR
jgi:hypothetical protein